MNTFKKYAAFFAVICLLLCSVFALGSCGEEEYAYNYKVTLTDTDGTAVKDAEIILVGANSVTEAKKTGEDGTVTWGMDTADTFVAKVLSIPDGYALATTEYSFAENSTELAIDKVTKLLDYTVTVKDVSGAVVVGASVTLNFDGTDTVTKATDANGIASFAIGSAETVKAKVTAPAGYVLEVTEYELTEKELTVSSVIKLDTYKVVFLDQNAVPVVGASLKLAVNAEDGAVTAAVLTDEEGVAVFVVKPGSYKLVVDSLPVGYSLDLQDAAFAEKVFEKNVTVTALSNYKVNVVDQYGNPVNGAEVKLTVDEHEYAAKASDANGLVAFAVAPGSKISAELVAAPAGYSLKLTNLPVDYEKNAAEATVDLYKNVAYSVRVLDSNESIVIGANVKGYVNGVDAGTVVSDEEGVATFYASPEATVSAEIVSASEDYTLPETLTKIDLASDVIETFNIIANKKYSVTVVDQYAEIVAGVSVNLVVDDNDYGALVTDAEGKVVFNVAPGATVVATMTTVPAGYSMGTVFEVTFNDSDLDESFEIIKHKDYTVIVVAQDGTTPIAGATVKFINDGVEYTSEAVTDAEGKIVFNTVPLKVEAYAQVLTVPAGYTAPEAVKFAPGAVEATVAVITNVDYTVTLKDQNGAAVPGASVALKVDGVEHSAQLSDAEGKVVFNVAPGAEVLATVVGGEGYLYDSDAPVVFAAGELAAEAVVHKFTYYTLVLKTVNGGLVEGATVTVKVGDRAYEAVVSDAQGIARVGVIPVDGATVTAEVVVTDEYVLEENVFTFGAEAYELTVDTIIVCVDYAVTVVDADGNAIAGVTVTLYKKDGTLVEAYVTGADGKVSMFAVDATEYYFTVSQPNTALVWSNSDEQGVNKHSFVAGVQGEVTYEVKLTDNGEKIAYTVTLKDSTGAAIAGKNVTFYNTAYEAVATATTDASGVATAELVNGTYYAIFDAIIDRANRDKYIPMVTFVKNGAISAEAVQSDALVGSSADTAMIVTAAGFTNTWLYKTLAVECVYVEFFGCGTADVSVTLSSKGPEQTTIEYNGTTYSFTGDTLSFKLDGSNNVVKFVINDASLVTMSKVTITVTK